MIPPDWQPETMIGGGAIERYRELVQGYVPEGGCILEIGSFHGGSIVALEKILKANRISVVACDMFDNATNPAPGVLSEEQWSKKREGMREKFEENIRRHGLQNHVTAFDRSKNTLLSWFKSQEFDLVFIDGEHTREGVLRDIDDARKLVKVPGVICGHDYCLDFPGVMQAVGEVFGARPMDPSSDFWVEVFMKDKVLGDVGLSEHYHA